MCSAWELDSKTITMMLGKDCVGSLAIPVRDLPICCTPHFSHPLSEYHFQDQTSIWGESTGSATFTKGLPSYSLINLRRFRFCPNEVPTNGPCTIQNSVIKFPRSGTGFYSCTLPLCEEELA